MHNTREPLGSDVWSMKHNTYVNVLHDKYMFSEIFNL